MDDEDTLLPRKLQAALEQALERKNDLINQDSDSESDEGKSLCGRDNVSLDTKRETKIAVFKLTTLLQIFIFS